MGMHPPETRAITGAFGFLPPDCLVLARALFGSPSLSGSHPLYTVPTFGFRVSAYQINSVCDIFRCPRNNFNLLIEPFCASLFVGSSVRFIRVIVDPMPAYKLCLKFKNWRAVFGPFERWGGDKCGRWRYGVLRARGQRFFRPPYQLFPLHPLIKCFS